MSRKYIRLFTILGMMWSIAGCSTPQTTLRNARTKQIVTCGGGAGGSLSGGVIGYQIEKSKDSQCIENYISQGFERVNPDGTKLQ
jgi:hypothetical protein